MQRAASSRGTAAHRAARHARHQRRQVPQPRTPEFPARTPRAQAGPRGWRPAARGRSRGPRHQRAPGSPATRQPCPAVPLLTWRMVAARDAAARLWRSRLFPGCSRSGRTIPHTGRPRLPGGLSPGPARRQATLRFLPAPGRGLLLRRLLTATHRLRLVRSGAAGSWCPVVRPPARGPLRTCGPRAHPGSSPGARRARRRSPERARCLAQGFELGPGCGGKLTAWSGSVIPWASR